MSSMIRSFLYLSDSLSQLKSLIIRVSLDDVSFV